MAKVQDSLKDKQRSFHIRIRGTFKGEKFGEAEEQFRNEWPNYLSQHHRELKDVITDLSLRLGKTTVTLI